MSDHTYPASRSDRTHGRCRACEARTGMPTVYRWRGTRGQRCRDAFCPVDGQNLRRTAVGHMPFVRILDEWPLFDANKAARLRIDFTANRSDQT